MYPDGACLYLLVGRTGSKSWVFRYRCDGRVHDMGLGPLHTVSLDEAREDALAWRKLRRKGVDPIAARRAEKQQAALDRAKTKTFQQCAEEYIADHRIGWKNDKHAAQWPSTLETYVYPIFGKRPVQAIDRDLVLQVLRQRPPDSAPAPQSLPLARTGGVADDRLWWLKPETASRVRQRIEAVLDWAGSQNYRVGENPARWHGHLEHLLPHKTKVRLVRNHPAMPYQELPGFMAALRKEPGIAARALEFTILTGMRTGAVIPAVASEITGTMWTLPAARMKGDKAQTKDFEVPLSAAALAIVEEMRAAPGAGGFLFPAGRRSKHLKRGGHLSNMAMLQLLERCGRSDVTTHGFRSTFKTWANEETTTENNVIEKALAHAIGDKVEQAYQRGELTEKRRQLMEAWARYCNSDCSE
jgi:integrase